MVSRSRGVTLIEVIVVFAIVTSSVGQFSAFDMAD